MKKLLLHILTCFYFWNFKKKSYSTKRKKAIKGGKYVAQKKEMELRKKTDLIVFKDEKEVICFSIQLDALYYIESDTNYITIYYAKQDKLEKYFMRSSLKMVLENNPKDALVRCHRSYIVNFKKVIMYKKGKDGGVIELSGDSLPPIPVSKSYIDNVLRKFQF